MFHPSHLRLAAIQEPAPVSAADRILASVDVMMAAARSLRTSSRSLRRSSARLHEKAEQLAEKIPLLAAAEERLWAERNRSLQIAMDADETERKIRRIESGEEPVLLLAATA